MRKLIKKILREEQQVPLKIRRRIEDIEWRVYYAIGELKRKNTTICIGYQPFLETIIDMVIESMYWDIFADEMDDSSKEWTEIYKFLEKYIEEKYIFELQKYYHINCGD